MSPDEILERIGEALRIVSASTRRLGPRAPVNSLPEILHEFEDFVGRDLEPGVRIDEWMDEIETRAARMSSAREIRLAEEALTWPARFLACPLQRDALWLVALSHGLKANVENILRRRRRKADKMVEHRKQQGQPDLIRIYEDDAADAAAKITSWANAALAQTRPGEGRKRARIRQAARIRFRREVKDGAIVELHVYVRRCDVMPGKVFSRSRVDHHAYRALERIAEGLAH